MIAVNLGPADRIPVGEGREFTVDGESEQSSGRSTPGTRVLAVFRPRTGALYATQASCPHKGGPLCEGLLGGTAVVCPLHGRSFDVATGAPLGGGNTCEPLKTYQTRVDEKGDVIVEVPSDER